MDFTFSEEQNALADLAGQIFEGSSPPERVAEVEASDERFDRALWGELAAANLLGVAVPEEHGGLGFGMFELAMVLQQQGRAVAPVPLLPTLVMGALPIARFGSADQRARLLPGVVAGETVLTGAFQEWGANDPLRSSVQATQGADGWELTGSKPAVPAAHLASRIVVPATVDDGLGLFLVDPTSTGVTVETAETTNRELHSEVTFAAARASQVGDTLHGADAVAWILERVDVAIAATAVGCCERATEMMAEYTSQREQFGRPLSHNQGVTLRAADCHIGTDAMRLVLWQAAWRIDAGLPASDAVKVAKWWAAEGGQSVVHDVQHLHGGMGADVDYPVHRYFLWVKQLENTMGGGSYQLAALGRRIADRAKLAAGTA